MVKCFYNCKFELKNKLGNVLMLDMLCASTGISFQQKKVSDGCCDDSRGQPVNINMY